MRSGVASYGTYQAPAYVVDESGSLSSETAGAAVEVYGIFNVTVWGTFEATLVLERSHDSGVTWVQVAKDTSNNPATFTGTGSAFSIGQIAINPELGVLFRLNCTSYSTGTAYWRLSQ